jgi:hypothetical protein
MPQRLEYGLDYRKIGLRSLIGLLLLLLLLLLQLLPTIPSVLVTSELPYIFIRYLLRVKSDKFNINLIAITFTIIN